MKHRARPTLKDLLLALEPRFDLDPYLPDKHEFANLRLKIPDFDE